MNEDDPNWDAATMGNRTGYRWQDGWWYVNGQRHHYVGARAAPTQQTQPTARSQPPAQSPRSPARAAGRIARMATNKVKRELMQPQRQPATVVESTRNVDSSPPKARVHFDDAPKDQVDEVAVSTGDKLLPGDRVWVQGEPPHGVSVTEKMGATPVQFISVCFNCSSPG